MIRSGPPSVMGGLPLTPGLGPLHFRAGTPGSGFVENRTRPPLNRVRRGRAWPEYPGTLLVGERMGSHRAPQSSERRPYILEAHYPQQLFAVAWPKRAPVSCIPAASLGGHDGESGERRGKHACASRVSSHWVLFAVIAHVRPNWFRTLGFSSPAPLGAVGGVGRVGRRGVSVSTNARTPRIMLKCHNMCCRGWSASLARSCMSKSQSYAARGCRECWGRSQVPSEGCDHHSQLPSSHAMSYHPMCCHPPA